MNGSGANGGAGGDAVLLVRPEVDFPETEILGERAWDGLEEALEVGLGGGALGG